MAEYLDNLQFAAHRVGADPMLALQADRGEPCQRSYGDFPASQCFGDPLSVGHPDPR